MPKLRIDLAVMLLFAQVTALGVRADQCRDVLELAARNYLHIEHSNQVHDRLVHDFCEAAEHFHENKGESGLTAIGEAFFGQFRQNSSDSERMYHSLCTHDDASHAESDYLASRELARE